MAKPFPRQRPLPQFLEKRLWSGALLCIGSFAVAGAVAYGISSHSENEELLSESNVLAAGVGPVDVQTTSWFESLQKSATTFVFGLIMFCLAGPLLTWNECQAARYYRMLFRARDAIRTSQGKENLNADKRVIEKEEKLICIYGTLDTKSRCLRDEAFDFEIKHCVRLRRRVEMYQWVETKHSKTTKDAFGNKRTETRYSYAKEWRSQAVSSSGFREQHGHENPEWWIGCFSETKNIPEADFGRKAEMVLRQAAIEQMNWFTKENLSIPFESLEAKISAAGQIGGGGKGGGGKTCMPIDESGAYYAYTGNSALHNPEVGDVKVTYEWIPDSEASNQKVTVMGKQVGKSLAAWNDGGDFCYDSAGGCILSALCFCYTMGSNKSAYAIGDNDDDDDDEADEEAGVVAGSGSKADYKTFSGGSADDESNKSKGFFELLNAAQGIHKASALLKGNEDSARCFQFALRLIGWLMMFFGLYCVRMMMSKSYR
mmetsp:Transcript_29257/g.46980  ORF Transcript_29257/g.46980 Transcript_29257/m.46980 type:complete len:486 (+) Transcript_29257:78-1535(+)